VLVNEPFSYPDGDLTDSLAWSAHSAAGSNPIQVSSGLVSLSHSNSSSEDLLTAFANQSSGSVFYVLWPRFFGGGSGRPLHRNERMSVNSLSVNSQESNCKIRPDLPIRT
jgi:hypothetical protein